MNLFILSFFNLLLFIGLIPTVYPLECDLPESCQLEYVFGQYVGVYNEKGSEKNLSIVCDINNDAFIFRFKEPMLISSKDKCENFIFDTISRDLSINFRWRSNELAIMDKRFNISNLIRYFSYFNANYQFIQLWDVKGFDVNILSFSDYLNFYENLTGFAIYTGILNGRLDFYYNKRKIRSCQDFIDLNITEVQSIFQIVYSERFELKNVEYKQNICPFLFQNIYTSSFVLIDLVDTFYKKNIFSFSNEIFNQLNSNINELILERIHNINLGLNLVHPSVFSNTRYLEIYSGSLNSIDGEIFLHLNNLSTIIINPRIFRKVNSKQGIEWKRKINSGKQVNLSNIPQDKKPIIINIFMNYNEIDMPNIFPDEDSCIYVKFPFNQLVIIYEYDFENFKINYLNLKPIDKEYSCTILWLIQYYEIYIEFLEDIKGLNLEYFINTTSFKSMSKCNFEERKSMCNKSKYQIKDIWDQSDYFILNKKIQVAFKISRYPVSFLCLITNFIVVLVILNKDNRDLFKEYKQYSYLYLNSIFCMIISLIELLSWMTECFYPFEVFCPETRKIVGIQFFKIIFKEFLVTMLRFMLNFTYVAFALNRINLIGREHGKLVTFMYEIGVKKYIGISFLISSSLSWIKGFKYQINYF